MAKISLYLDMRSAKVSGRYPLKVKIFAKYTVAYIPTGIDLLPEEWDDTLKSVIKKKNKEVLNIRIMKQLVNCEDCLSHIDYSGLTAAQIRDRIMQRESGGGFEKRFIDYMSQCATDGNRKMYEMCLVCMRKYDSSLSTRDFKDIDKDWLEGFDRFLSRSQSVNTRSIRMRCIRAVFNDAINDGLTDAYPFRRFRIRQEETIKRSLSLRQLEDIRAMTFDSYNSYQEKYRDIFMLMFFLCGINAADLFLAKKTDVVNGRLEYRRRKTHKLYSIKIEPEAQRIIDKYQGKTYLLNICESYDDYSDYLHRMDIGLQSLGRQIDKKGKILSPGRYPGLTSYWSRHTWATIAHEIGVSVDVIGQALGHSDRSHSTTMIYIKLDRDKVDIANKQVIDYVVSH